MIRLFIVLLIFSGGVYWGSIMQQHEENTKTDIDVQLEQFEEEINEQKEISEINKDLFETDHPVEKVAYFLEKIISYLYDKLVSFLFWLSNKLFSI